MATSFAGTEIQRRSYPNSFGGQYQTKGYELVDELNLLENARRVAEESVALHKADQCPSGEKDIILDSSQLGLQIHESIGHPIELDRVLGTEANFAGMSFLTVDKLNNLKYASDIVNVVADATPAHGPGLGTFAYDDEGVPAQCTPIIKDGLFVGYLSSRETASAVGLQPFKRIDARGKLEPDSPDPHDQREHPSRNLETGRSDCGHRRRHLYGDQSELVDR